MANIALTVISSAIKTVPATAVSPGTVVFTVTGGPIKIVQLIIEVTTVIANTATLCTWATTDTVSATTQTISGASLTIATIAAGRQLTLDPVALSTAIPISAAGGSSLGNPTAGNAGLGGIIMMPGTCNLITDASPATGNIKYHLTYLPLGQHVNVVMA